MYEIYESCFTVKSVVASCLNAKQSQSLMDYLRTNTYFDLEGNEFFYASEMNMDMNFSTCSFSIVLIEPEEPVLLGSFVKKQDALDYVKAFDTRSFNQGHTDRTKILYIRED